MGCINVYGPRYQKDRKVVWEKLDQLCQKDEVKWAIFGDFNKVRGGHEKFNSMTNSKGYEDFFKFIQRNRLEDV